MKKNIKVIGILNIASYINNLFLITYFSIYKNLNIMESLDAVILPIVLAIWILSPIALILITAYCVIINKDKLYSNFKKELIIYFSFGIIAYLSLLSYTDTVYLSYIYFIKMIVQIILMLISSIIILRLYMKVPEETFKGIHNVNFTSIDDRKNIEGMKKAASLSITSIFNFIIFGLSLILISSQEIIFTMEVLVTLISVISFVRFVYKNYEKCKLAYLDEKKRMKILKIEMTSIAISYSICVITSMNLFRIDNIFIRQVMFLISVIMLYPVINGNREIFIRYKNLKESLFNDLVGIYNK